MQRQPAMPPEMRTLQNGIDERQQELQKLVRLLSKKAQRLRQVSNYLRSTTIFLSAVVTARASVDAATSSAGTTWLFLLISILLTTLLGLEASFKFDKRAAELNLLVATAQSTLIMVDGEWRKKIGSLRDSDLRNAGRDILTLQESKLAEIHQRAASLGLNLVLAAHELESKLEPNDRPRFAA